MGKMQYSELQFVAEIICHFQLGNESYKQVNHALYISHISCLYRAVHVAQREREIGGGHAAAGAENLVCIGTGSAAAGLSLHGDAGFIHHVFNACVEVGVACGAEAKAPTLTELDLAVAGSVEPGAVGGVGDIQTNGGIRLDAVGEHGGADTAYLFLNSVSKYDVSLGGNALFFEAAGRFCQNKPAETVIKRTANKAFTVVEHHGAIAVYAAVTYA